jgi:hypothetical protein
MLKQRRWMALAIAKICLLGYNARSIAIAVCPPAYNARLIVDVVSLLGFSDSRSPSPVSLETGARVRWTKHCWPPLRNPVSAL